MSDIDLVPTDYRRRLERLDLLRGHAIASLVLLAGGIAAYAGLDHAGTRLQGEVDHLQQSKAITEGQRADLERLHAERTRLAELVGLQVGLAGGIAAQHTFVAVDRALRDNEVWFTRWAYQRSGKVLEESAEPARPGYVLVIPQGEGRAKAQTWRIDTHMTIDGEARDHAALSSFVSRLLQQPEVAQAHLLNSTLLRQTGQGTVSFKLLVSIDMEGK